MQRIPRQALKIVGHFTVAPDHPALPGHFPGRPIVPGVVLLDHAVSALLGACPGHRAAGLPAVKFMRPVRPGDTVEVACAAPKERHVAFTCAVNGQEVARGTLLLGEPG